MASKILVSACLLGQPVRYNGSARTLLHPVLERWRAEGRLVPVCPELSAGLPVPRPPAEIAAGRTGGAVLSGTARIIDSTGTDVTRPFLAGAEAALATAVREGCRYALLTDGSPSCGSRFIHDGGFSGRTHAGDGVTAALLRRNGIEVFAAEEVGALEARLSQAEQAAPTPPAPT
ncbi:DUF523 domain-containing protein [Azospirillum thermophilum]|uniref:DUF523 domain-containing protein n=1 Tax=Azospirillum thermophilum TaxID=2202148 RepID=A0A2S2CZ15_9PROT|nr:DUF523 domain-containing protein [Azospirillum thermophilum]AWK89685.1 DUF523 domain-containing protein [Azospirillum thermophilum]